MDAIRLYRDGARAVVEPKAYLGSTFGLYRQGCEKAGVRFNPKLKRNETSFDGVASAVDALTHLGFKVEVDPELVASVQAAAAAARSAVIEADARTLETDAKLRARGLALFPFQKEGVRWLAPRKRAILGDEMGLGKSLEALLAAPAGSGILVLCPAVAKGVWLREAAKWRPDDLKVAVLKGRGTFRWPEPGELVVTNYDILPEPESLPPAPAGVLVIADEAHVLKSAKAMRTIRARGVTHAALHNGGAAWGLTATPLQNRPQELWAVLHTFQAAQEVFTSWWKFLELFGATQNRFGGYDWGSPSPEVGERLKRVMLRRVRSEVLKDLPTLYREVREVPLSSKLTKQCDAVLKAFTKAGMSLDQALEKIMYAESGGVTFEGWSETRKALALAKAEAALEIVEQFEEQETPLVVFSAHIAALEMLGSRPGWALITGGTSADERTRIEDEFQAGKLRGIAASIQAGGVAITLTYGHHALFIDRALTPALNQQAEYRLLRIGQANAVQVILLQANHVLDQRVEHLLGEKQALIDGSIEQATVGEGLDLSQDARSLYRAAALVRPT